jgi:hypothetical protein
MYSSPVRHFTSVLLRLLVRLACVKRAASVRSEPGSNSHELGVLLGFGSKGHHFNTPYLALLLLLTLFSCQRTKQTGAAHSTRKTQNLSRGVPISARINSRIVARGKFILSCPFHCQAKSRLLKSFFMPSISFFSSPNQGDSYNQSDP